MGTCSVPRRWWIGWAVVLTSVPVSGQASESTGLARRLDGLREVPDDAPGVPARSVPGAPRAVPVALGPFASVQVNVDANGANIPGDAANEPSIAVDPTNPDRIAIGWRQFDTVASNFRQAGYGYSTDGGRTWTFPGVIEPGVFRSDPVLDFDANGTFYYDSLSIPSNFEAHVFRSIDGGATWGSPVFAFGGDKQWFTIDRTGGPGAGNLYQAWNVFGSCCGNDTFNRSLDGGATFGVPTSIPGMPDFGTLAVGPAGELYVCGWDPSGLIDFVVARSTDAHLPATPSFTTVVVDLGGDFALGSTGAPNPGGLLGQAWIAVDRSGGPNDGHVYALASVDPPGPDPLDVRFARSTDGGATWSPSVRVNDDPSDPDSWQWFGTMSVAPNGRIDVVWNDTRASGAANVSELYLASSADGGLSFSANRVASPAFDSWLGWPNQNKIGDYYDMISDATGAHLAWAATFNGEQDVYYLRICAAEAAAGSTARNGGGGNPLGFVEVVPAVVGSTWDTLVDVATPGALASLVVVAKGGPTSGILLSGPLHGELLCLPPFLPADVAAGAHSIPIPDDCSLVGRTLSTQAATVAPGGSIALNNALDVTLGSF